jgi:hypothetical protein
MADLATALQTALNKTKEKQMTTTSTTEDVKKIAREWDKDEAPPKYMFQVSNNVSRATFDLVKANPGCMRADILTLATKQNYNPASVSSLLAQFVRVGQVRKDADGRLYVTQSEYSTIKYKELRKAQANALKEKRKRARLAKQALAEAKKQVKQEQRAEAKPARIVEAKPTPAPVAAPAPAPAAPTPASLSSFDADQLLSTLSFTQAITLYKKLKLMLGEV